MTKRKGVRVSRLVQKPEPPDVGARRAIGKRVPTPPRRKDAKPEHRRC